jgi:hypothetical protein
MIGEGKTNSRVIISWVEPRLQVDELGSSTNSQGRVSALNPTESNLLPKSNSGKMNRGHGTDYCPRFRLLWFELNSTLAAYLQP